jgi:ABC-type polysaccharide/polyol phosphate export permease
MFLAVAEEEYDSVGYSSDGINWQLMDPLVQNIWTSVCWSKGMNRFCAVGLANHDNRAMFSSYGYTSWEGYTAQTADWTSVCWSEENGIFVAVASMG